MQAARPAQDAVRGVGGAGGGHAGSPPGHTAPVAAADLAETGLDQAGVELTAAKRVHTNIGVIHDPGHDEPWIVAMSDAPGDLTPLDHAHG